MKLFGMCLDKRAVTGVVAAAAVVWWLFPGAFAAAVPFLLFAICPLSMLLMMKAMNGMNGQQSAAEPATAPTVQANAELQPAATGPDSGEAPSDSALDALSAAAADVEARRN